MFSSEIEKIAERLSAHPLFEQLTTTTTYVPSKFSVDVSEDKAVIALAVLGHDADDIEINCYEDKIEIKSNKPEEKSPYNDLISKIDERVNIGKNFDGRNAKAVIKNGILTITLERKEESKPKKVTIKVG
jgi:HSP20 family protein